MAAELVGGAFLSSLFGKLFDKLDSPKYLNFFRGLKLNDRLLKKLKIMLCSANQVLDDAELKQLTNPNAREWLFELKEAICVAEELLDDINYEILRYEVESKSGSCFKKLKSSLSSPCTTFDHAIQEILDMLEYIVKQQDLLGLKQGVKSIASQRLPAPLADDSFVYGRNGDKEKIIELLLSDNGSSSDKISVIPIVGMGGIGKTTLAQLIYEDKRVKSQFRVRSWVVVSDESDISIIAKKILEEITSQKYQTEGLYQLQSKLKDVLSNKKFFFVLDDVWNENYEHWEVLFSSFQSGVDGSRIIVTTRSDTIAKKIGNVPTHHLEKIPDNDCWKLFVQHVFRNVNPKTYQELHVISKDIVKKCKGVPLVVKSLAGLLRSVLDPEEWKRILNSDLWELQLQGNESNNILPSLWLSYHYLPMHLKRCFAYCSIFPKDYVMNEGEKRKIILLWMAEGLLQPGQRWKQIEEVGNEYYQDLVSRSLFQPLSKDKSTILMHDLMHDLAVFVSGEFSFRLDDSDKTKFSSKTRHFSYSKIDEFENFECLVSAKSLHTRLLLPLSYGGCMQYLPRRILLLPLGGCLRALCLSRSHFPILPDSIGNLKHLRYLDLSYNDIEEIPNTLCTLYHLQTLLLSECRKLTQLPIDMGNLVNLRHLFVEGVPLEKLPPKMCNLKDLQTLSNFVAGGNGGSSIKELGGLHYLSGTLEISKLQIIDAIEDVRESNLKHKEYLNKLVYRWNSHDDSRKDKGVLDGFQPHTNIKELVIDGYGGETFSNWVGHCSFTYMVTVHLLNCYNFRSFPSLGQLPSLQSLRLYKCPCVERINAEFYYHGGSSNIKPFRSLKFLEFEDMSEWQEWSFPEGHEHGECFPNLEHLRIYECPKLNVCLPDCLLSLKILEVRSNVQTFALPGTQQMETAFPSLELLNVDYCPILETFLLRNLPSNFNKLFIVGYDAYCWKTKVPLCLVIGGCENVITFPEALLPTTLTSLHVCGLENLEALNGEGFQHLTCLEELRIEDCNELQCFLGEMLPTSLTSLHLARLGKLEDLGEGIQHIFSLKQLRIKVCEKLRCLSGNGLPASLTSLSIENLPSLEDISNGLFQQLTSLEELEISCCQNLHYTSLEENEKGFQYLISLKKLEISSCPKLQSLLEENGLPRSLTSLWISDFPMLEEMKPMGLPHLNSLKELTIGSCENLQCLPEEGLPSSLSSLRIYECPLLEPRCQKGTGSDWHKISHIPHVVIDIF